MTARVLPLAPGPLGPRFRVAGLRGNNALAGWLLLNLPLPEGMCMRASAASGIVRFDVRRATAAFGDAAGARIITDALAGFGLPADAGDAAQAQGKRVTPAKAAIAQARQVTAPESADPAPGAQQSWHALAPAQLYGALSSGPRGLSGEEAAARLASAGPNAIPDVTARAPLQILVSQFQSLPVALLAGSGVLAAATRAFGDAAAVGAVLAANGGIGFLTERRAEQTVTALRRLAPGKATVVRDGIECDIAARDVVVGDLLLLQPGDQIPADARVIEAHRLSVNEAPLTGESLPVRKDPGATLPPDTPLGERRNCVHMGTTVSGGSGRALVTATGERTALGQIRALAQEAQAPRTRLQQEMDELGRNLALGAAGLCVLIFGIGILRGRPMLPLLRTAVSLGVAAIPEGLPTVATSLLAAGVRNLQRRNIYPRRLDAIENLGAISVVAFDKTGTLTQNRMTVATAVHGVQPLEHGEEATARALPPDWTLVLALCNELECDPDGRWQGSSTELALLDFATAGGLDLRQLRQAHPRIELKQRSEHHPYMVTLHAEGDHCLVAMKGRPAEVLHRCTSWDDGTRIIPLDAAARERLLGLNEALAARGQRVLALAIARQQERSLGRTGDLTWLGLVGLADPLRPRIAATIARFRDAGIRPIMLTGDQPGTARAVAHQIGLDGERGVIDTAGLSEDAGALAATVEHGAAFSRASPAMKLQLIRSLQHAGHVVAMTGDGINDGPALRSADVGVAMGATGTSFAMAMSDLVLRDDHPEGLLEAISLGRSAYLNVRKAVRYLIATNASELALMGITITAGLPDPLDPLALLWMNLITDVSPAIALGLEPPESDVMQRPPFRRESGLLSRSDWRAVAADAGLITAATLAAYGYGLARHGPTARARTIAFMTLTGGQLLYALSARSAAPQSWRTLWRGPQTPLLTATVLLSLGAQAGTILFPPLRSVLRTTLLDIPDLLVVSAMAAAPMLSIEAAKRMRRGAPP